MFHKSRVRWGTRRGNQFPWRDWSRMSASPVSQSCGASLAKINIYSRSHSLPGPIAKYDTLMTVMVSHGVFLGDPSLTKLTTAVSPAPLRPLLWMKGLLVNLVFKNSVDTCQLRKTERNRTQRLYLV